MAPLPTDEQPPTPQPTDSPPTTIIDKPWSTPAIVSLAIFAFFVVALAVTMVAFYLHRRAERNKLPIEKRPISYHPFRTNSSNDKQGLLANQAPSPEEDKSSMFSRDRSSANLSVYVDHEPQDKRASVETVSLIPLHVTPAEELVSPLESSMGSGVSRGSSLYSSTTGGSLGMGQIPIPPDTADIGSMPIPKTRARSTSATSMRYYETATTNPSPQIPKIVHTPSQ